MSLPPEANGIIDRAHDAIILSDPSGVIAYWNPGAEEMYGWSSKEALGQHVHALLRTTFCDGASALEESLRKKARWSGELRQIRRDGTEVCVDSRWSLANDAPDALRVQINSDITARKLADDTLRECEERYRRFVEEDFTGNLIMRPGWPHHDVQPGFRADLWIRFDRGSALGKFYVAAAQPKGWLGIVRSR